VTLDVDKTATDDARARRVAAPALIDRGPSFEEAESRWHAARGAPQP